VFNDQPSENSALIAWEGDSLDVISGFPEEVKGNLGFQLRALQLRRLPANYRPMPSIGQGVYELRDQDERAWYRVIYLKEIKGVIHVLHCFEKQSRKTSKPDIDLAKRRLKLVHKRLTEK
jgi:phage-related protein